MLDASAAVAGTMLVEVRAQDLSVASGVSYWPQTPEDAAWRAFEIDRRTGDITLRDPGAVDWNRSSFTFNVIARIDSGSNFSNSSATVTISVTYIPGFHFVIIKLTSFNFLLESKSNKFRIEFFFSEPAQVTVTKVFLTSAVVRWMEESGSSTVHGYLLRFWSPHNGSARTLNITMPADPHQVKTRRNLSIPSQSLMI